MNKENPCDLCGSQRCYPEECSALHPELKQNINIRSKKTKIMPEIIMHYNVQDERYYIYFGEDYITDTDNLEMAIYYFKEQCELLKLIK